MEKRVRKILVANRGEIAVRVARAAAECDVDTVMIYAKDDARSLHVRAGSTAIELDGSGAQAYLNIDSVISVAKAQGCDAIHPGYGLLSENAEFARKCAQAGITFVGPSAATLELLGDKINARKLAEQLDVAVLEGTVEAVEVNSAKAFFDSLNGGAMIVKAVAGGGGRGMRIVHEPDAIENALKQCRSEAENAFGCGDVYLERYLPAARHIEVQIIGDGQDVAHLWERDCTIQRRNQKLVEIAPAPTLDDTTRQKILAAAMKLAAACDYKSLGTFEFLVDAEYSQDAPFYFMEANPRIQVEHTVTEEITGIDLVQTQLHIASGKSLADVGINASEPPAPAGLAVQLRINMESMAEDGNVRPEGGTLSVFEPAAGPGVRVDTFGYAGYRTSQNYDSLLAKLIVHSRQGGLRGALKKAQRGLKDFRIEGVVTNAPFLDAILSHENVRAWDVTTRFIDQHLEALLGAEKAGLADGFFECTEHAAQLASSHIATPAGTQSVVSPIQGVVVSIDVAAGEGVQKGQQIGIVEAMKMEYPVVAPVAGTVHSLVLGAGDMADREQPVIFIEPSDGVDVALNDEAGTDPNAIRPDLQELFDRQQLTADAARPEAMQKRHAKGYLSARENIALLCDEGSFNEYGQLAYAAQTRRRSIDDLIRSTPADGMITGFGGVNGDLFDERTSRTAILSYDATVLAGTQGHFNHKKTDRILEVAEKWKTPVIFYTEGGGGRPGDVDMLDATISGLTVSSFSQYARMSGLVPRIGIANGYCFAGNAAFYGCSDITIATRSCWIGMGGPAMIEGGGLGKFAPTDIGPIDVQYPNGVVDILADDEAHATELAKKALSYFQGAVSQWEAHDQRRLRSIIPENRKRAYDIREAIELIADVDSVLELRRAYGAGIVTAFIRIEGQPFGLIANDIAHLGGAIEAESAEKASRFMQLCDAFDIPILSLCDTPGFMVGPDSERTATVRRVSRLFVTAATMNVPNFVVVLHKAYGLGAQAMAGGNLHSPGLCVSWPSGAFGGMGFEGAVRLGYGKELDAAGSDEERQEMFDRHLARMMERGKAISVASKLEVDAVIDPAETRSWLVNAWRSTPLPEKRLGKKRPMVDTW